MQKHILKMLVAKRQQVLAFHHLEHKLVSTFRDQPIHYVFQLWKHILLVEKDRQFFVSNECLKNFEDVLEVLFQITLLVSQAVDIARAITQREVREQIDLKILDHLPEILFENQRQDLL